MLTGCTKTLTGEDKKAVKYEETGKALTENILCKPTNKDVIELYKENKVDVDKLPSCENFKPFSEYEGLWTTVFVKPLAWVIINIGVLLGKTGLSKGLANGFAIILSCLVIRLILYPFTRKTAMQSEKMKEVQPQLEKLEKKYIMARKSFWEMMEREIDFQEEYEKIDDKTYIISGKMPIYDVNKLLNSNIPEGDYDTLSGYLQEELGRIPTDEENPIIETKELTFKIEEYEDKRIIKVKVCKNQTEE